MNTIDAIEGIIKSIIDKNIDDLESDKRDDSEYIRNVKTTLEAMDIFFKNNVEVATSPVEIIRNILYDYAKENWMQYRLNGDGGEAPPQETEKINDFEYLNYYYDYIYDHGVYPL